MAFRFRAKKAGLKGDVAGFGQDEFLEFEINPRDWKMSEGGLGEIVGKSFDEFALFGLSGFSEELAEVVVVDRVCAAIGLSGLFEVGNRKNGGAEEFLRFDSFGWGNSDVAEEFKVDQGESWSHEGLGRRMIE